MTRIILTALLLAITLPANAEETEASLTPEGLILTEAAFGAAVVDRELESKAESFALGQRVYLWTRLIGGAPNDLVYHVWYHEDREIQVVELSVQGAHWRTWSYKTLFPGMTGSWRVEVQDRHSNVLGVFAFTCVE